ncbi:MAG: carbohydrate ABC transporter permease [Clostridiales bacterium]|nr:carbohydrate ABC transporter permease [Clostridiales bacterium]
MSAKVKSRVFIYLVCAGIAILVLGPILVTLFASVKDRGGMIKFSTLLPPPPSAWTWDNYLKVFKDKLLPVAFKNSISIIAVSIVFNILFGSVTAYCLERFEFKGRKLILALFYMGMLVPTFVAEIARFKLIQSLHLYNTLGAPIVIYIASDLMQLFIYRQFISKLPSALDESALVDGASYFRIFGQIIFPLLAPATATLIIVKAVNIINDMYIPYLYMPKNSLKTLTTFLMNYANAQQGNWNNLAAAIVIVMVPTVVIYIFFQEYIFDGISAGAVKE